MDKSILSVFWDEEAGQDMVEYSLLLAFIALAAVALLKGVSTQLNAVWTRIQSQLSEAAVSSAP